MIKLEVKILVAPPAFSSSAEGLLRGKTQSNKLTKQAIYANVGPESFLLISEDSCTSFVWTLQDTDFLISRFKS